MNKKGIQVQRRNPSDESREEQQVAAAPPPPAQEPTAIASPTMPPTTSSSPGVSQEMEQFMQRFVQQMMQQQDDFMQQMVLRQEQMNLETIRERENMQREWRQHLQRSTPERTAPTRDLQNLRSTEEIPANELIINLDDTNVRSINRRDSAVHRLTTFNGLATREGVLTMASDKHANIIWENRSIDGFLKFLDEIDKFTLTYNQPVPYLFTHINENLQEIIAELLYVNKPQKYTTMSDVFKAMTSDIIEMAQIYFAPRDLAHFNTLLSNACRKYEVIQKGDFYAPTRLKLYGLKKKFKERYDFLVAGAEKTFRKDCIPAINYKQGGLLNIWTDLTPEGSRESFKQMLINGKYDTLDSFLDRYFAKVDETNNLSENIKIYKYRIGGKSYLTEAQQQTKQERVYNIEEKEQVQDAQDDQDGDEVFAIEENVKMEFSKEACPKLLLNGKCWQRDCKYSHRSVIINQQKEKLMQEWSRQSDQRQPTCSTTTNQSKQQNVESGNQPLKNGNWSRNSSSGSIQGRISNSDGSKKSWQSNFDSRSHKRIPTVQLLEEQETSTDQSEEQDTEEMGEEFALISAFMQVDDAKGQHNVARKPATARVMELIKSSG